MKPGRHVQLIVLRGKELCTIHSALGAHGRITLQGFWHSVSIQACLLGHSWSPWHPGGSGGGTKMQIYRFLYEYRTKKFLKLSPKWGISKHFISVSLDVKKKFYIKKSY